MWIEIGPVEVDAARCWLAHVGANLDVVRRRGEVLPFRLPDEVAEDLEELLAAWRRVTDGNASGVFHWIGDLEPARVRTLVRSWANLDSLTDDLVRELGLDWSPPAGRPFFVALAVAVAEALAAEDLSSDPFADLLVAHGQRPVRSVRTA